LVSTWAAHQTEIYLKEKDSSKIIIDEAVSFLITMFLIPCSLKIIAIGFILNRFFDVTKIYPAKLMEKKCPGGLGIMLDDIVAGIYSNLSLRILIFFIPTLIS
jgi:phosphatidylglycerophosphatase A